MESQLQQEETTPQGESKDLPVIEEHEYAHARGKHKQLNIVMEKRNSCDETLKAELSTKLPEEHVISASN